MYGMMPSAKIEKRDSAPPENMLNMSRMPPCCDLKSSASCSGSMPGTGMNDADAEDDQRAQQEQQAALEVAQLARTRAVSPSVAKLYSAFRLRQPRPSWSCSFAGMRGFFGRRASTLPPAASIAARAPLVDAERLSAATLRLISPAGYLRARRARRGTTPAAFSAADRSRPPSIFCRSDSRTSAVSRSQ